MGKTNGCENAGGPEIADCVGLRLGATGARGQHPPPAGTGGGAASARAAGDPVARLTAAGISATGEKTCSIFCPADGPATMRATSEPPPVATAATARVIADKKPIVQPFILP